MATSQYSIFDDNTGDDGSNTSDESFTLATNDEKRVKEELEVDSIHPDEDLEADEFQLNHFMGANDDDEIFEDAVQEEDVLPSAMVD